MSVEGFDVCITVAAMHIGRSQWTLRQWAARGFVPRLGLRLDCFRHPTTNVRYFKRSQVNAISAALHRHETPSAP